MKHTLLVLLTALLGCIKAPQIVVVDRATALEQQAGGSFVELEKKLATAAVTDRPAPFTPDQLDALGMGAPALVDRAGMTDADRVDALLEQHCAGEGRDGLLVGTADDCHGATDQEELVKLVDRVNTARSELWRWMHVQRPEVSLAELRQRWRTAHTQNVACGAWIQGDDGKWQSKSC